MTPKDHVENIIDTANRRLSDPFIGSYIFFFFTTNFEVVLHFFSNEATETKILNINKILNTYIVFNNDYFTFSYLYSIITPLFLSLFYCFIYYPYIFKKIYEIIQKHRVDVENIKSRSHENLIPVEQRISKHLSQISQIVTQKSQLTELLKNKDELFTKLQKDFNNINQKNLSLEKELAALTKKEAATKVVESNTLSQYLSKLKLHEDLILAPRDYKLKHNFNSAKTIEIYHDMLLTITSMLERDLENSKSAKDIFTRFRENLNVKKYSFCYTYLEQASNIPSLKIDEKNLLKSLNNKIQELDIFTK